MLQCVSPVLSRICDILDSLTSEGVARSNPTVVTAPHRLLPCVAPAGLIFPFEGGGASSSLASWWCVPLSLRDDCAA